ncbi:glycoside hydrolase family 11 protein [Micromonospora sp. NPDC051300]|uniref:glycoside hydrolase family 11 protein n=1 Tax=Micromonospora sp. NPDC051300 TaxID=3364286 RepID=UPI00379A35D9
MNASPSSERARGIGRRGLLLGGLATAATAALSVAKPGAAFADETVGGVAFQTGYHNGYFYSFYTDIPGSTTMYLKDGGEYAVSWNSTGNSVVGKGWDRGSWRTVNYEGYYAPSTGGSFLTLYGWSANPLIEYYVIDNWGGDWAGWRPAPGVWRGTVDANGGTYDIYQDTRYDAPSVEGTKTFDQFFSVRQSPRTGGSITTNDHFTAWANLGMNLGSLDYYMIVAAEGINGSGNADIHVS